MAQQKRKYEDVIKSEKLYKFLFVVTGILFVGISALCISLNVEHSKEIKDLENKYKATYSVAEYLQYVLVDTTSDLACTGTFKGACKSAIFKDQKGFRGIIDSYVEEELETKKYSEVIERFRAVYDN